jgi:predicted nucleic acid-binding protein
MNAKRYAFDTNIFFYSIDHSAGRKHIVAKEMVNRVQLNCSVVFVQTLGELANSILKKRPALFAQAESLIADLAVGSIAATREDLTAALAAHHEHHLPFWDAMLWAIANRSGCDILFTEDFQHDRTLGNVTFINPFILSPEELAALFS